MSLHARCRAFVHILAAAAAVCSLVPLSAGSVMVAKPEEVGLSTERLRRVTEAIRRHIDAGDVAGVVTLAARRGRIAHFEAQGSMDLEAKTPMA